MKNCKLVQFALMLFCLLLFSSSGMAQQKVSGIVTDSSGNPLTGVSVNINGTKEGTATNAKGYYQLTAPQNGILVFSYIGYQTKQIAVNGRETINVSLSAVATGLSEVVVVAFGTKQKSTLIESVAQVDNSVIKNRPVNNAVSALQGQVAGVNIVSYSGQPGIAPTINIRGVGSINSSTAPLVIIDGVPGSLSLIDPNDIASISVLKDASAASLYGARSANGVILVTTKRGKVGKIAVSYSGYV